MNRRSLVASALHLLEIPSLVAAPLVLLACVLWQIPQAALVGMVASGFPVVVMCAQLEVGRPPLRQIMPTVVMGALAAAGRILFAPVPDFKPVSALCIMAGVVFGKRCGFLVGALAALVSNFFFGQGPWTLWQMYAWGLVGYLAGVLAPRGVFDLTWGRNHVSPALYVYGFLSGLLYGAILNTWYVVGFIQPITLPAALAAYGAGLPFDLVHGVATVVFLAALYEPWKRKLTRIRTKFALLDANHADPPLAL